MCVEVFKLDYIRKQNGHLKWKKYGKLEKNHSRQSGGIKNVQKCLMDLLNINKQGTK